MKKSVFIVSLVAVLIVAFLLSVWVLGTYFKPQLCRQTQFIPEELTKTPTLKEGDNFVGFVKSKEGNTITIDIPFKSVADPTKPAQYISFQIEAGSQDEFISFEPSASQPSEVVEKKATINDVKAGRQIRVLALKDKKIFYLISQ